MDCDQHSGREGAERKVGKNRIASRILLVSLAAAVLLGGAFGGYRLVKHEQQQSARIAGLTRQAEALSGQIRDLEEMLKALRKKERGEKILWNGEEFNWFAIGNSITLHEPNSHWWNPVGMAASDAEHDYFALVRKHLEEKNGRVHAERLYCYAWETQDENRDFTLLYLDPYLDEKLDLVTIQLGENVSRLETFEKDFEALIGYVKGKAPKARIAVIGDFWMYENREELKRQAAANAGVEFISLEGIRDNKAYQCGLGTTVFDAEGGAHTIDHDAIASHPGDKGMQAIAEKVIETLDR